MTILRFIRIGKTDYVGWNDEPPVVQAKGCTSLYDYSSRYGGCLISDEHIEGWFPFSYSSQHIYCGMPDYGNLFSGAVYLGPAEAAGFNMKSKTKCWRTGNNVYRLNKEQLNKYMQMSDADGNKYLDGLYPPEVDPLLVPAPRKEGKVRRPDVIIPF